MNRRKRKRLVFADSWELSGQIRVDIDWMKAKLNTLIHSEKSQENVKKSIIGAIKEFQAEEDKQKPKVKKESSKEAER